MYQSGNIPEKKLEDKAWVANTLKSMASQNTPIKIDLADTGISQKDWLLTTRSLLGGYHYNLDTWVREFEPVLESREDAERGPEWLKKVLPIIFWS